MSYAIMTDFGSTYTKVVCVNRADRSVVLSDKVPSTVHEDARIAYEQCMEEVRKAIGTKAFQDALKLSTSSAAGGLRMAVCGLTKNISSTAGRNVSFNAGARITGSVSGHLTEHGVQRLGENHPEILLLCGGHEGGNTRDLLHNAAAIAESSLMIPVIYAGNSHIAQDVRRIFGSHGKECFVAANIIPDVGLLNTEPTADIIRDLFMNRITNMQGVAPIRAELDGEIVPTPAAVLAAGELLSTGTAEQPGLGDLMMADIGGATTDIYSYNRNVNAKGAKRVGTPEPFAKRTVEGDMGMRESSILILGEVGTEELARQCNVATDRMEDAIQKRITDREYVADNEEERRIDHIIACNAVKISARRHAGKVTREFSSGVKKVQRGKNLTSIQRIVGTGGIIVNGSKAKEILNHVTVPAEAQEELLLPSQVEVLVDHDYVLFAAGLLRDYDENAALSIMKKSLRIE